MRFTMLTSQVFNGPKVSLIEMLEAREERQKIQNQLITKYSDDTLLSITLNIPGEVKTSAIIEQFFKQQIAELQKIINEPIIEQVFNFQSTGNEAFMMIKSDPLHLKKQLIAFEESAPERRILDLDVLYWQQQQIKMVSRKDFDLPSRACLVCSQDAKVCGRERKHPVEEIQLIISALICSSQ